jgi:hypothetical protein
MLFKLFYPPLSPSTKIIRQYYITCLIYSYLLYYTYFRLEITFI